MKIIYTLPGISTPHGGYRIVMEHLTRLQKLGHEVALYVEHGPSQCNWYDHDIFITGNWKLIKNYDCLVIGSPHSIRLQDYVTKKQKCFLFMQMDERKFRPNDGLWDRQCRLFYNSKHPIIHGSKWGERVCRELGRKGPMHYIGNGVNFDHFPISNAPKDGKTILLEGAWNDNPAKDTERLALWAAQMLKQDGYRIIAYGFDTPKGFGSIVSEYYYRPSLADLNSLYERATILLKATKYDARALSPVEAATKSTPTVRSIIEGDDDLIDGFNCIRIPYENFDPKHNKFFWAAKRVLDDDNLMIKLSNNARTYVQEHCNWDTIILQLEKILMS